MAYNNYGYNGYTGVSGYQPTNYQTPSPLNYQLPRTEVIKVNGRNGVDAFQMAANSSVLLLDQNMPVVWFVQTDGAGYKTATPYNISPYQEETAPNISSLEARIKRLEDLINGKPNSGANEPNSTAVPVTATISEV